MKMLHGKMPAYLGIYNSLYSDIVNGVFKEDEILPSEPILSKQYSVSRNTLRQALAILIEDGLICKSQGKGTRIARNKNNIRGKITENPLVALCRKPAEGFVVDYNFGPPTDIAREKLQLSKSEIVLACNTVYRTEGKVVGYCFMQIPTNFISEFDIDITTNEKIEELVTKKIFAYSEYWGVTIKQIQANKEESALLEIQELEHLLLFETILHNGTGRHFARCKFYFLPDYYHLEFGLSFKAL